MNDPLYISAINCSLKEYGLNMNNNMTNFARIVMSIPGKIKAKLLKLSWKLGKNSGKVSHMGQNNVPYYAKIVLICIRTFPSV